MKVADIIAAAEETVGTKWVHQGRMVGIGLDCIGVVLHVCRRTGFSEYEPPAYPTTAQWYEFEREFDAHLIKIPIAEAGPGDVLIFRQEIFPCHCGVLVRSRRPGELRFIHGYLPRREVVEEKYSNEWRQLTRAAYRFPGLEAA